MKSNIAYTDSVPGINEALTEEQAREIIAKGPEWNAFVLLQLSGVIKRLRNESSSADQSPSAPSSATPVYKKPTAKRRRGKKRGARQGHPGASRPRAAVIDRVQEHSVDRCPECGEAVVRCRGKGRTRSRVIEDIPEETRVEAVEHVIHRAYCPKCKKTVEPKVDAALPGSQVGHRAVALASWFRFGLGIPLNKIAEILNSHLSFQVSNGSVVNWGHRMAEIFGGWYQQIGESVKESGVVNADETGRRVLGKTHWLWCFCSDNATYYQIDRSRGSPALTKFFTDAIAGTLVTDFWSAYNRVECGGRQKCLPHLFRELDSTSERDLSEVWQEFRKEVRRLLKDGLRLAERELELDGETYLLRRYRLDERLSELLESWRETTNRNVLRILKRLRRHREEIFTFLDPENGEVPSDNNRAEREIRPAVIMRKNSNGNQSERGATTQAVLMTVFRTLRRRGYDPLTEIVNALRHYTTAGNLPPLPT